MFIINADDFGLSESVNQAIAHCFKEGLINRTTILVNMPWANAACKLAEESGFKGSVGLHINLVEGPALTDLCRTNTLLCNADGNFRGDFHLSLVKRFFLDRACQKAIHAEIEAQIQRYIEMGFTLMHADSHRYVHTYYSVARIAEPLLLRYGFKSIRISRNLPGNDLNPAFALYKSLYNRHLHSIDSLKTTEYFGSMDDYLSAPKKADTEIMVHPVMKDGVLMDDTLPSPKPFFDKVFLKRHGIFLKRVDKARRSLLVVFLKNHIGGSMTSLVNFLNTIDPEQYDVDLLFSTIVDGMPGLPDHVQLLKQAKLEKSRRNLFPLILHALNPLYHSAHFISRVRIHYKLNETPNEQLITLQSCRFTRKLSKKYDAALAFELNWCMYYMVRYVHAKRKFVIVHNDYHAIGYDFRLDKRYFNRVDGMGFVSDECMEKFLSQHPQYMDKSFFVPNITARQPLIDRAQEALQIPIPERKDGVLHLLSVARVSFAAKGIDRMIPVFLRLREEGLMDRLRWVVLGGGEDLKKFRSMIKEHGLENHIYSLGKITNPMPYMRHFDAILLPSRTEGKPMVVVEAQILGLPPVVTRYTSAGGQIEHNVDGIILENNDEALYQGIRDLILHPEILTTLRDTVISRSYSNEADIEYFYHMVDTFFT